MITPFYTMAKKYQNTLRERGERTSTVLAFLGAVTGGTEKLKGFPHRRHRCQWVKQACDGTIESGCLRVLSLIMTSAIQVHPWDALDALVLQRNQMGFRPEFFQALISQLLKVSP